jgi:peptide-methionine (S)-S-oxide reductase
VTNQTSEINEGMARAYFATGCFWGAERRFWQLNGVIETSVGYLGGTKANPTYEEVCTGKTGHAEGVEVIFDPSVISYRRLLEEFWVMHDPTSLNKQGGDIGTQYRSAIFTTSDEQQTLAMLTKSEYQAALASVGPDEFGEICTEILPIGEQTYWLAEEYHQKYLAKNPNGYDCHSSTGVGFPSSMVAK